MLVGAGGFRLEANIDPVLAPTGEGGEEPASGGVASTLPEEIAARTAGADPAFERALVREQMPEALLLECLRAAARA